MQAGSARIPLRRTERAADTDGAAEPHEGAMPSVERRPGDAEDGAGGLDTHHRSEFNDGGHQSFPSGPRQESDAPGQASLLFFEPQ